MSLKEIIRRLVPPLIDYRNRIYNRWKHSHYADKPIDEVFQDIYLTNHWRDSESTSGTGSNQAQTSEVKKILIQVIRTLKINSLLDAPCGDFNWMKEVRLPTTVYYGADIVKEIIDNNTKYYGKDDRFFIHADITQSKLPKVDLMFCRDCLVHFSYDDIQRALINIKSSEISYLLTTTFPLHKNYDIITGDWRPVNLEASPFNLPAPLRIFSEHCTEDIRYSDKSLALWRVKDLLS